ncbi:hypothetical protein BDP27DRAFT_1436225 [Rhodocollybia butyracea]|uniref:F-box domain-containing protein n=1 Tax=Rhodocollybia butyracea TaxID=206335 RepID=A0A9P5P4H3_9AGAR|nr:hypothetical protein BDP27DRAFT_1436225 [Rhodocollybia butyracea]
MTKAEELPSELQDEIFSFVASDLHSIPNLALVDKRVNERLLSTFYSTVELTSGTQLKKFIQLDRPKVTTLTILSIRRAPCLINIPRICPNIRKLALVDIPFNSTFCDKLAKLHQLRTLSVQQGTNFSLRMEPDHSGKAPILESLTHLDYGTIYPWSYSRIPYNISLPSFPNLTHVLFHVESKDSPADIALTVEVWLKFPGLKRLILRFCSDRDMVQFRSSISGKGQIDDPRVVCFQMPSPSPLSSGDHFEFLNQVWALGDKGYPIQQ